METKVSQIDLEKVIDSRSDFSLPIKTAPIPSKRIRKRIKYIKTEHPEMKGNFKYGII